MSADIRTCRYDDIVYDREYWLSRSIVGFIYRIIYIESPRISDKKVSSRNTHSSYLRDVRIAYRTVFLMSFQGRTSGGTISFRIPIGPSAAAPMGPISYLCTEIKKPKTLDDERHEGIGERQQDMVLHVKGCGQNRSMVRFIVRCSNHKCA